MTETLNGFHEEGEPEAIFEPYQPLAPEVVEALREHGVELPEWRPSTLSGAADREWLTHLHRLFPPDALDRLARAEYDYYSTHGQYVPGLAKLARVYHDAGNVLRMAVGEAILVTTADEVRMPRADWDRICDAAIAQRRATDPTVDDGE